MVSEVGWPAEEKQKKLWQHSCKLHPGLPRSTRHREPDPGLQGEWSVHLPGYKYLFPATALADLVRDSHDAAGEGRGSEGSYGKEG